MTDKPKLIALASLIGVITNVLFNFFLIPKYGVNGAAVATSIGFITSYASGYIFSRHILLVKPPYILFVITFVIIFIGLKFN